MGVRGSWAKKIREHYREPKKLYEDLAKDARRLTRRGFDTSTNPYGKPWAKRVFGRGKPLVRTRALMRSYGYRLRGSGFVLESNDRKAGFHQEGTGIFGKTRQRIFPKKKKALKLGSTGVFARSVRGTPVRLMLPNRGLPKPWRDSHNKVFFKFAAKVAQ